MRRTTSWLKHSFERVRSKAFGVNLYLLMAGNADPPGVVPVVPVPHFQISQEVATPACRPGVNWTRKTCVLCKFLKPFFSSVLF
jgi:hypothetical protein